MKINSWERANQVSESMDFSSPMPFKEVCVAPLLEFSYMLSCIFENLVLSIQFLLHPGVQWV